MKKITILTLALLTALAFGQDKKKQVAVYMSGQEPEVGLYSMFSGELTGAIMRSGAYEAIDRTADILRELNKEIKYTQSGAVDENSGLAAAGRQLGVQYVCVAKITQNRFGFYLEAKMLDVSRAVIEGFGSDNNKLETAEAFFKSANAVAEKMLGFSTGVAKGGYGGGTSFKDPRDGQTYKVVKIGSQVWFAQNLNYQTNANSWCYGGSSSNCDKCGRLYTWNAAIDACPDGWHLPSNEEWDVLVEKTGGKDRAGQNLKAKESRGEDKYGFSALLGGCLGNGCGGFNIAGSYGFWWSSSVAGSGAYYRSMGASSETVGSNGSNKTYGYSVRCLKD